MVKQLRIDYTTVSILYSTPGRIIIVLIRLIIIYSPRVKVGRANEIILDYKIDRSLRISGRTNLVNNNRTSCK